MRELEEADGVCHGLGIAGGEGVRPLPEIEGHLGWNQRYKSARGERPGRLDGFTLK